MSGQELVAILLGLVFGYLMVAKFSGKTGVKQKPDQGAQLRDPPPENSPPSGSESPAPLAWHTVLGVSSNASLDEIRSAYKSLVGKYHPDKVDSMGPEVKAVCEAKSKEINLAYEKALKARCFQDAEGTR
jgi:DnaJ like chaperone protein